VDQFQFHGPADHDLVCRIVNAAVDVTLEPYVELVDKLRDSGRLSYAELNDLDHRVTENAQRLPLAVQAAIDDPFTLLTIWTLSKAGLVGRCTICSENQALVPCEARMMAGPMLMTKVCHSDREIEAVTNAWKAEMLENGWTEDPQPAGWYVGVR
jgi:hypothetical protein